MSLINKTKYGDCSSCSAKDTYVVKVGRDLFCLDCRRRAKVKAQIEKAKNKALINKLPRITDTGKELNDSKRESNASLQRWFEDRRKEMTGYCKHCQGKTERNSVSYKCSIAHILPKATFKSVATHPKNWVELCFYGKSCHTNFDNSYLSITELNCFDEVIEKFLSIYPDIAPSERRRIPHILLSYVNDNQ